MRKVTAFILGAVFSFSPMVAPAQQTQTLADIRQELSVVYVAVQRLKRELSTTGSPAGLAQGGSALQRIDAIESQLQRLTARTEELEFRIGQVVSDGTNRIGDLEFRLCELEPDCDIATLGEGTTLGGDATTAAPAPVIDSDALTQDGPQLAVGEQADFDAAKAALDEGDYQLAAELFETFSETYPGGPLSAAAHLHRGEALAALGEDTNAARAYLEAFSTDQDGPLAPNALFRLGEKLGHLGQTNEACVTLTEVGARFPQSDAVLPAEEARARIGCR